MSTKICQSNFTTFLELCRKMVVTIDRQSDGSLSEEKWFHSNHQLHASCGNTLIDPICQCSFPCSKESISIDLLLRRSELSDVKTDCASSVINHDG